MSDLSVTEEFRAIVTSERDPLFDREIMIDSKQTAEEFVRVFRANKKNEGLTIELEARTVAVGEWRKL